MTTVSADSSRPSSSRPGRWSAVLRSPLGVGAGVLVLLVVALAVVGPLVWSSAAERVDVSHMLEGPSNRHLLGTDNLGRDLFARTMVAARSSIVLALLATAVAVVGGLVLGLLPVLLGRRLGRFVTAIVNIALAFPGLLLALFFAIVFGVGARGAVLAVGIAGIPSFARLVQTLAAGVAGRDYVTAARLAGANRWQVATRHILPNTAEPLVVNATIGAGGALLAFAGLSFLGLGVQPPAYDWGRLLGEGLGGIYLHPAAALGPGVAVVIAGLAFNLFGEAVAKVVGPPSAPAWRSAPPTLPVAADHKPTADGRDGRTSDATPPVLEIDDLHVRFPGDHGTRHPVRGVTFTVREAETVGVVGESGSGKSLTALAVARLIEYPGVVDASALRFHGHDLRSASDRRLRPLLGPGLAVVFQDPSTSLNPTHRIGSQLAEAGRRHGSLSRRAAWARAVDRLAVVGVPRPKQRARQYPHELSGGMRQRAMIGLGLMSRPSLVIADEPTTALDVRVQRQVLDLLRSIQEQHHAAIMLISHDVAVVREVCDRVLVMYAGRIVEDLPAARLGTGAHHPYTRLLAAAVPGMTTPLDRPMATIPGRPPEPAELPPGCAFAARCPLADARCTVADPPLIEATDGTRVACWHAGEPLPDPSTARAALGASAPVAAVPVEAVPRG